MSSWRWQRLAPVAIAGLVVAVLLVQVLGFNALPVAGFALVVLTGVSPAPGGRRVRTLRLVLQLLLAVSLVWLVGVWPGPRLAP